MPDLGAAGRVLRSGRVLKTFTVAPAETTGIPLLVATDSFISELGCAIPAGPWGIEATLDPAAGHCAQTPVWPLTITS